jgi:integrase
MKQRSSPSRLPLLLALWTGQRQGELLKLPWSAYDGAYIRLRQSKTGVRSPFPSAGRSRRHSTLRRR